MPLSRLDSTTSNRPKILTPAMLSLSGSRTAHGITRQISGLGCALPINLSLYLVSLGALTVRNRYLASGQRLRRSESTRSISQAEIYSKSNTLFSTSGYASSLSPLSRRLSKPPLGYTLRTTRIPLQSLLACSTGGFDDMTVFEDS